MSGESIDTASHTAVPARRVADIRAEYGPRLVLAVGRLTPYKGFDVLVRAMRQIDATLVIVGDGELRGDLAALVDREQLTSRVHLLGNVADARPFFAACDLFVLPSVTPNEAFGLVQLEAMAFGKPVVNTSLDSGVTYASPHRLSGLTVAPGDATALAAAIQELLADADLRATLGAAGRERVHDIFSLDAMVARTFDIYSQALAPPVADAAWLAGLEA